MPVTEKTEKTEKIDPERAAFELPKDRLEALERAVAELQRLSLEHNHRIRSRLLNYVDKPVFIKEGQFVNPDGTPAA